MTFVFVSASFGTGAFGGAQSKLRLCSVQVVKIFMVVDLYFYGIRCLFSFTFLKVVLPYLSYRCFV